jgi:hypothetical protein
MLMAAIVMVSFTSDAAGSGRGFRAIISSQCPPGTFSSPSGWATAWPCTPCPPGRYNPTPGASVCAGVCTSPRPYSKENTLFAADCSSCVTGCEGGGYGAQLCPANGHWTGWSPPPAQASDGVASGVCLSLLTAPKSWSAANASCAGLASGAHLATPSLVCCVRLADKVTVTVTVTWALIACMPGISDAHSLTLIVSIGT